ncbi:hypothetical protein DFH08DRAFT_817761 [Mycena albidolilacea]|uniref:Uncharacterized protein n=1 Tax=Mycena albidolilacea TaxID=1033008 RepID=A0AAD6ZHF1_9AGAR|nr:hypothetical protein DFH08DRAFT_817761 [Mycena albidolilacea]
MKFSSNFSSLVASIMLLQGFQHVSAENFGKMCFNTNMGGTCTQFAADGIFECVSFKGSNAFWNDVVSSLQVYSPFSCNFFVDWDCTGKFTQYHTGTYNTVQYNDQYSSFLCGPNQ